MVILIALIAGLTTAAIWLHNSINQDDAMPKRWGVVEPGLIYRSGQSSAGLIRKILQEHNIAVIVDLAGDDSANKDQQAEKQAAAELGIKILRYRLQGNGTGDIENYARAIAAIVDARNNGKPVLVHCGAGAQRTGGVIACYRVLVEKKPPSFAYAEMMRYDWNPRKDKVLLTYINGHMAELASLLKQMRVIDQIPDPLPFIGNGP
jgi:protein tyrosine/serine phosphatase